jgi:prevent-host-death family protein
MKHWQLQEAKAKLSQLVRETAEEPQQISVHGKPAVVVVSQDRYEDLTGRKPSFVEFLRRSPLADVDLRIERDRSRTRPLDL